MKLLYFLLLITYVSGFYTDINLANKEKIIEGKFAEILTAPYHASLFYLGKLFCGAAIIAESWLLSAEKCFIGKHDIRNNVKAKVGIIFHDHNTVFTDYIHILTIEKYSQDYPGSDVSTNLVLVLLDTLFFFNQMINRIPISDSTENPPDGTLMTITGFGKLRSFATRPSKWLKVAELEVITDEYCPQISERLFCAYDSYNDTCEFDEGGPGVIGNRLVTIITGTPNCGNGAPGVYTKVGAFYLWIMSKLEPPV